MAFEKSRNLNESRVKFSNREYLGFATYVRNKSGQWRLRFNWRRIIAVFLVLVVAGYLSLASLLYCWFCYKHEWEGTKFTMMLVYPFDVKTRIDLRKEVGDKIINDAKEEFQEKQDFGTYFQQIRAGLVYSPNNSDGRIDLASLLFFQRRTQEAFEFLCEGLPYAVNHRSYIPFFVRQSLELAQDDVLIKSAENFLPLFPIADSVYPEPNSLADNRLVLAIGAAQAHLLRGRFDEALKILKMYKVEDTLSGRVLLAQIDWELGNREKALDSLDRILALAPGNEQISMLYSLYLKESGDLDGARDVLTKLSLLNKDPKVRIKIISLFPGEEDVVYRKRLEDEYFQRYQKNSEAMLIFAQYATDLKDIELVKKIYTHAQKEVLIDLPKFELLYLETLVLNNKPKEALTILDELESGNYAWVRSYQSILDCLRAIAYYSNGQANLGKISLDRVLKSQSVPVARLIVLARRLDALGFEEEARTVYENAYLLENGNQAVLLELVNYALKHEDVGILGRYLPPLLETRRPPRSMLERVQGFLGSDRMLFVDKRESLVNSVTHLLDNTKGDAVLPKDNEILRSWF